MQASQGKKRAYTSQNNLQYNVTEYFGYPGVAPWKALVHVIEDGIGQHQVNGTERTEPDDENGASIRASTMP